MRARAFFLLMGPLALAGAACQKSDGARVNGGTAGSWGPQTSAFAPGAAIPKQHTADGADVSPPLTWPAPPGGTKTVALVCDDPDAPAGTWVHWVVWNIPPDRRDLPENVPKTDTALGGIAQGTNDFGKIGWGGPSPPPGKAHRYFFKLYALDATPDLRPGAKKADLEGAMKGHVLAQGEIVGTYGR